MLTTPWPLLKKKPLVASPLPATRSFTLSSLAARKRPPPSSCSDHSSNCKSSSYLFISVHYPSSVVRSERCACGFSRLLPEAAGCSTTRCDKPNDAAVMLVELHDDDVEERGLLRSLLLQTHLPSLSRPGVLQRLVLCHSVDYIHS